MTSTVCLDTLWQSLTASRVHFKVTVLLAKMFVCRQSVAQGGDVLGHCLQLLSVEEQRQLLGASELC